MLRIAICPVLCFLLISLLGNHSWAQERYLDSLKQQLSDTRSDPFHQVVLRCQVARALFETHLDAAFDQLDAAEKIAVNRKDESGKALVFATKIHLAVQKKEMMMAYAARDSALYYESKSKEKLAKGMVWLRSGWLDLIDNENDAAVPKLLKAIGFFEEVRSAGNATLAYHYLASIYSYGNDLQRQQSYAAACLRSAQESQEVDMLNTAYYTMGQSYFDRYKGDVQKGALLDSALAYYRSSIRLSQHQGGRILVRGNTAAVALNTANIYFQYFPASYRDSVYQYLEVAEHLASETRLTEVLVNCYGIRSEYALKQGDIKGAEQLLLTALQQVDSSVVKMPLTKSRIYRNLAHLAEQNGQIASALAYLKSYIQSNQEAFDQERLANSQRVEARYKSVQQAQKIALLEKEAAYRKKRQEFYLLLGAAGMLSLTLLAISYNYQLKASLRKQELIEKEKKEVALQGKLQQVEAERLSAEQALLRERQERLEKELLAEQLRKEEKDQLMELLADQGTVLNKQGDPLDVKRILKNQQRLDRDYDQHKADFLEANPLFFERLQRRADHSLTRLDMKYCSYILMGLPNKEISLRLGIEPKSIRMARYRIKQKLKLGKADKLDDFIFSQLAES